MRRKDRRIDDLALIEEIIGQARVCRLALHDLPAPYIVPMSFGYRDRTLYFHAARDGHKINLIKQNPQAGFDISIDLGDVDGGDQGCEWSVRYRSVTGHGHIVVVENVAEKRAALDRIMGQYAEGEFFYPDEMVARTLIFKLNVESMTGKAGNV
ncbi:MAG: pyridoxamine 5'-phosphate oxidase family protein [Desulfuromonas sp.]|nr:MAG: pyridoxamine 5'-phosphate oxidase family protein [Desulfuromonas sp.]